MVARNFFIHWDCPDFLSFCMAIICSSLAALREKNWLVVSSTDRYFCTRLVSFFFSILIRHMKLVWLSPIIG